MPRIPPDLVQLVTLQKPDDATPGRADLTGAGNTPQELPGIAGDLSSPQDLLRIRKQGEIVLQQKAAHTR